MARPVSDDAGELIDQVAGDTPAADVEVFDPAHRAHRMRLAGKPWHEVTEECGYPTTANAVAAVAAYLQRAALERASITRQLALEEELARLDEQYAMFHPMAQLRDVQAGRLLLQISKQRSALLRLIEAEPGAGGKTIIITAGAEMAEELRNLVLGSEPVAPGPAGPGPTPPAAPSAQNPE